MQEGRINAQQSTVFSAEKYEYNRTETSTVKKAPIWEINHQLSKRSSYQEN
ncbi:TPA: hypothetical protein HA351_09020 [Methanosarcinaceae archaeon]|nr:hypothetical protein [Methanosarcinaceae archaeon]